MFFIVERKGTYFVKIQDSPNNPHNLKLISIQDCRQCVIMSTLDRENLDNHLVDKSSVLCALNIRQIQMKRAGLLSQQSLTGKRRSYHDIAGKKLMRQNRIHTLTTLSN